MAEPAIDQESDVDSSESGCPICRFIEAGPCKTEHQVWSKCRDEARGAGKDHIEECMPQFKVFLQCVLQHDYYEPLRGFLAGAAEDEPEQET